MSRFRGRVSRIDVAIAIAVTAALELDAWAEDLTPRAVAASAFAVLGSLLVWRRAAPLPVLVVGLTTLVVAVAAGMAIAKPVTPLLFYVLILYAVGLGEELTRAVAGLVVAIALTYTTIVLDRHNGNSFNWTDFVFTGLITTAPWIVGRAIRGRVRESEALERRAERLERERLEAVAHE